MIQLGQQLRSMDAVNQQHSNYVHENRFLITYLNEIFINKNQEFVFAGRRELYLPSPILAPPPPPHSTAPLSKRQYTTRAVGVEVGVGVD